MKSIKSRSIMFALVLLLALPMSVMARDIDPVVSTSWLEKNLANPKVVIVDLRKVEEYKAGHIPGAVNSFYGSWAIKKGELLNELPALDDLFDVIGAAGIGKDSLVVLVGKTEKLPDRFDMTRVAWTLKYVGLENIAILDGGQDQWAKEGKPVKQDMVKAKSRSFKGQVNKGLFVDKAYVLSKLGKAVVLDTRGPAFFEGKEKLPFVAKLGRVKGAVNLPVGLLYTKEGLYKSSNELGAAAEKAAGADRAGERILYCDTGKTCTSWAFVMTDLLGYKDVKIYDGSFMEWAKDAQAPVE
jgi:thiosulfate/3-mercaptopyruvate sulfurtransferase